MLEAITHTLVTNESSYCVVERGKGRNVLLYPSLGRAGSDFDQLATVLNYAGYRTFSVTPPGFATELGSPHWDSLFSIAGELWEVVHQLKIENPVAIGHALGNRVMRAFSTMHPEKLRGIVLLACGGDVAPSTKVHEIFLRIFDSSRSVDERERDVREVFFAPGNHVGGWRDGWNSELAFLQGMAVRATDVDSFYLGGDAPGLIIQGLNDVIAPPQNSINLVSRRPNSKLVNLENCGHAMLPEQPQRIGDEVVDFLRSLNI